MAYKYVTGSVFRGDIYNEDDAQGNTYIDWNEDAFGVVAGGTTNFVVSSSTVGIGGAPGGSFALDIPVSASTVRMGRLELGAWPHSTGYGFVGHSYQEHHGSGKHLTYNILIGSAGDLSLNSVAGQDIYFRIGAVIKAAIDSNGFFSIGPNAGHDWTPSSLLHLSSSDDAMILLCHDTQQNPVLAVTGSGRVGIGTETPDATLHVEGTNGGSMWEAFRVTNTGGTTGDDSAIYFTHYTDDRLQAFIKDDIGSSWDCKLHFGTTDSANSAATKMTLDGDGKLGIGTETPDHELTIVGNVSASSNVSASAFYGDMSSGAPADTWVNIHAPWLSGSSGTYEATTGDGTTLTLAGYNFASGISASLESQATTDGHSWGGTTWDNPVSVSFAVTGSSTNGNYDIILTNTDGLTHTLTDACVVAAASLQEIEIHDAADIENSVELGFTDSGGVGGALEGLAITGNTSLVWDTRCHTVAEIGYADHAYIEVTPTVMGTTPTDAHHWIFGFGYKDDYAAGTYGFEWMGWAVYCWGGGPIADRADGGQELTNPTGISDTTKAWMAANRSLRIEIIDNTAYLKYSDDDWATESTFHTFENAVDISGNSNLVAGFAVHNGNSNQGILENIKMYGRLEGI